MTVYHEPVLASDVVDALAPADGEIFVDCTVGGGGHSHALLSAARCFVIGIDRDPDALAASRAKLAWAGERFLSLHGRFSDLDMLLNRCFSRDLAPGFNREPADGISGPRFASTTFPHTTSPHTAATIPEPQAQAARGWPVPAEGRVHGILADFGVSSYQLDTASRGFSLRHSGPIDMRMDPGAGIPASALIDSLDEQALADLIWTHGEERHARRIARQIVAKRPFADTRALAEAIASAVPDARERGNKGTKRIHPATRTFQALRIAVNGELDEIDALLPAAFERLLPGGRLAFVSFHSLEDRRVKRFFDEKAGKGRPRDPYGNPIGGVHLRLGRDISGASDEANPRARSARLRSAVRLPWNAP